MSVEDIDKIMREAKEASYSGHELREKDVQAIVDKNGTKQG